MKAFGRCSERRLHPLVAAPPLPLQAVVRCLPSTVAAGAIGYGSRRGDLAPEDPPPPIPPRSSFVLGNEASPMDWFAVTNQSHRRGIAHETMLGQATPGLLAAEGSSSGLRAPADCQERDDDAVTVPRVFDKASSPVGSP